ncbi:MAG: hypothetical protein LBU76_03380 [Azoarcus sp.]|jgi:hypothetical protein|nr:hypothetical protein [Azoarcus sp.]
MSACAPVVYGPSEDITDATYVQAVQAVIDGDESIKSLDKGYFLANSAAPGFNKTWGVFGTIVVTDKTLYFLFWKRHDNVFQVLRKLPMADIANIAHATSISSPSDYLSIEDKNQRFDVFSYFAMYKPTAHLVKQKNSELLNYLNAVRNAK